MMKNVWMSPHNRLKDSLIIDRALKFLAFIEFEFNFGAEFRAKRDAVKASLNLSSGETP